MSDLRTILGRACVVVAALAVVIIEAAPRLFV